MGKKAFNDGSAGTLRHAGTTPQRLDVRTRPYPNKKHVFSLALQEFFCIPVRFRRDMGDSGPAAYRIRRLPGGGFRQGLWRVLPLGPLGYGDSPYSGQRQHRQSPADQPRTPGPNTAGLIPARFATCQKRQVVYEAVFPRKMPLLAQAAPFSKRMQGDARARFERFCHVNREWLDDFAVQHPLRAHHKLTNWNEWPRELAHREPASLDRIPSEMADELVWRSALRFAFAAMARPAPSLRATHGARGGISPSS